MGGRQVLRAGCGGKVVQCGVDDVEPRSSCKSLRTARCDFFLGPVAGRGRAKLPALGQLTL